MSVEFLLNVRINLADQRHSYGEDRFQLLGRIGSRIFVVVYTPRPQATRIISARKANTREVKEYDNDTTEN
ncbi:BrnT family toxin [Limnohabitans sp. T6-5]|uniref:BrnT family toxin n=1 Tax=Limnohabitans sp. T6-5 TaxID=1100724 RepID=UPI0018EEC76C|nr:BrnT family toxin [Limnohabitans sp. T6-5]